MNTDDARSTQVAADPIVRLLAEVLDAIDAPSPELVDGAVALFALRGLDAELLVLHADSANEGAGVRDDELQFRLVVFQGGGVSVELELSRGIGVIDVIGQVTPAGAHAVTLQASDDPGATAPASMTSAGHRSPTSGAATTDEFGRFQLAVPDRPFALAIALSDGRRVRTPLLAA